MGDNGNTNTILCCAENIVVSWYTQYMGHGNVYTITKSRNSTIKLEIVFIVFIRIVRVATINSALLECGY